MWVRIDQQNWQHMPIFCGSLPKTFYGNQIWFDNITVRAIGDAGESSNYKQYYNIPFLNNFYYML